MKKTLHFIAAIIIGFLYFVSPLDIVPDALLPFGYLDDGIVIFLVLPLLYARLTRKKLPPAK
jgi:uncharacterized membrane protein YkvA (DUF1232 family)